MAPLRLPIGQFTEMDYLNFSTQSPRHHWRHHNHSHHKIFDKTERERSQSMVEVISNSVVEVMHSKIVPENSVLPDLEPLSTHLDGRMNVTFGFNSTDIVDDEFMYRHNSAMTALYCVAYFIVFLVGLVGNFFVIAVVYRSPRMRTVTNFFIVNLAVADILVICFCLPATLMSNVFVREYFRLVYSLVNLASQLVYKK